MNTIKRFNPFLLLLPVCILFPTELYPQTAEEPTTYSWRLDSLTYNSASSGWMKSTKRVYYEYNADEFVETDIECYFDSERNQFYRLIGYQDICRNVYGNFGENGRHTMDQYTYEYETDCINQRLCVDSASAMADLIQDPSHFVLDFRDDYAYDTYRNIFDNEGNLIRQIRNYDYIRYKWDESQDKWIPSSRSQRIDTDSMMLSKNYKFNSSKQDWENASNSFVQSFYRNHRLWKQEKVDEKDLIIISGTEYNENGGIVRTYWGRDIYGSETYYNGARITGTAKWATSAGGETTRTTVMYMDGTYSLKTVDTYRLKTVKRPVQYEKYIVQETDTGSREYPLSIRSWRYGLNWELTDYSGSVSTYDSSYRCTLKADTVLRNGVWTATRTEYDENGNVSFSQKKEKSSGYDEWDLRSESTPLYKAWVGVYRNRDPWERYYEKKYVYGFGNRYYMDEKYNSESGQWECYRGRDYRVGFSENGEPLSCILYSWTNHGWYPTYQYAFAYDTVFQMYAKIDVGNLIITIDGSSECDNSGRNKITYYNAKGIETGWFNYQSNSGQITLDERDQYGRVIRSVRYVLNEAREKTDTTQYTEYTYFPNDKTSSIARQVSKSKNAETQTWQIVKDEKNTKKDSVYSKEGILLQVVTYGWKGDETAVIQTMKHNDLTYDGQGRIKERITYRTKNVEDNMPYMRYVYYYLNEDDPKWYAKFPYGSYDTADEKWKTRYVPQYKEYTAEDGQGRVVERITYLINSDTTALRPSTRKVYYYANDAEDWTMADNYSWDADLNDWKCSGTSTNSPLKQAVVDDEGNVLTLTIRRTGSCEQGLADAEQYDYSYGADLTKEFVLSPRVYGMQEERNNENRPDFSPVASKRLKHIQYTNYLYSGNNYTVTYHYTPLVDGLEEDQMPIEINPEETGAVFTWGAVEGAQTYVLHVYSDAAHMEEICYVIFDGNGMVLSIHFIPHAPAEQPESFRYTLSDLNPDTSYWYGVQALDSDGKTIESTYGSFHTKAAPATPTAVTMSDVDRPETTTEKIIYRGQVYIRQGDTYYTLLGQPVQL